MLKKTLNSFLCFLFYTLGLLHEVSLAQETEHLPNGGLEQNVLEKQSGREPSRVEDLSQIVDAINSLEQSINKINFDLKSLQGVSPSPEIENQLKNKRDKLRRLKANLNELATGVNLSALEGSDSDEALDWGKETHELLSPLLNELKKLTSRPRELDRLNRKISSLRSNLEKSEVAITNIKGLLKHELDQATAKHLESLLETWREKQNSHEAEIAIYERRLRSLESESTSFTSSIKQIPDIFFRSRVKNLLIAVSATLFFWWGLRSTYFWLRKSPIMTSSRFDDYRRIVNLIYLCFSGSGAAIVFLLALLLLGDWVLLIISFMLVFAVIWTSKQALPHFWHQGTLLLNIGPVREGELVIFQGVPWKVLSLNLYVKLQNPLLQPSAIRVPLNDLVNLRSRSVGFEELWFPTKVGDWVLVEGDNLAQVIRQSSTQVTLSFLGKSFRSYPVSTYIEMSPHVLSEGFRISTKFGIDYSHQKEVVNEIPNILKRELNLVLDDRLGKDSYKVVVELDSAGASSLDLRLNLDLDGKFAKDYQVLLRLLQQVCVQTSNKNNWIIPFNQLTVHMANGGIKN